MVEVRLLIYTLYTHTKKGIAQTICNEMRRGVLRTRAGNTEKAQVLQCYKKKKKMKKIFYNTQKVARHYNVCIIRPGQAAVNRQNGNGKHAVVYTA